MIIQLLLTIELLLNSIIHTIFEIDYLQNVNPIQSQFYLYYCLSTWVIIYVKRRIYLTQNFEIENVATTHLCTHSICHHHEKKCENNLISLTNNEPLMRTVGNPFSYEVVVLTYVVVPPGRKAELVMGVLTSVQSILGTG